MVTALLSLRGTPISYDLTQFMPTGVTEQQQLAVELLREGPSTRLIILALEGGTVTQLANTSRRMAGRLADSDLFLQVVNGDTARLDDDMGLLFRYRYLLDPRPLETLFSVNALHTALLSRLDELNRALPLSNRRYLASDPTGTFNVLLKSWMPAHQPVLEQGVWFSPDRKRALLVVVTAGSGFDPLIQQQAITVIHSIFRSTQSVANNKLLLSGAPVFTAAARDSIRTQLTRLTTIAGVLVSLFLLFAYRSPLLMLLGAFPLLTAMLAGATAVAALFGGLHGITLVFGITLLGVAIDYPIHLFSHLTGIPDGRKAIKDIWPTLRLGVITTCIGYLAFARPDFIGLAQLGVFTTAGLLAAAAVTRWLLPGLIPTSPRRQAGAVISAAAVKMLGLPPAFARMIIILTLLAIPVLLLLSPPQWETDLQALSPLSSEQRQLANELSEQLGGPQMGQLIVVRGKRPQQVLRSSEQLADQLKHAITRGLINDFDMAARYLPSTAIQEQRQAALPDDTSLRQQLRQAMQGLPFKDNAFTPFLEAVSASRSLPAMELDSALTTPVGARIRPLLYQNDQGWFGLVTLSGMASADDFEQWWQQQKLTCCDYLNLKRVSVELLTDFRDSTLDRLLLGILAILLVVSIGLRSPLAALKTLLPVLLAVGLSITLLGAMGERLSLFHLVSLLLTAGIGIDYSLFFQRRGLGRDRRLATLHALTICAVSTVTVFAILASSQIPVLRAIGLTVTLGILASFALALAASRLSIPKDA